MANGINLEKSLEQFFCRNTFQLNPDPERQKILTELENWVFELGFQKCILETGINQPEAIRLYKK